MAPPKEFKLRPVPPGGNLKEASRIYVRKDLIFDITGAAAENGRPCIIENADGKKVEAVLFASTDPNTAKNVAKISPTFLEASGFNLSDIVQIKGMKGQVPDADEVVLEELSAGAGQQDEYSWRGVVGASLNRVSTLFPGMVLKDLEWYHHTRTFKVVSLNKRPNSIAQYHPSKTEIILRGAGEALLEAKTLPKLEITGISGIDEPLRKLNNFLSCFANENAFKGAKSAAVVLHGGRGTGKTMLLDRIAKLGWGTVYRITPDEKLSSIKEILSKAREGQPSIVILDKFDELINPKKRTNSEALVNVLCEFLDSLYRDIRQDREDSSKVLVVAACRDYTSTIPEELRLCGRLRNSILLPMPDLNCRRAIIDSFPLQVRPEDRDATVTDLSQRTHAYNGHDLVSFIKEAIELSQHQLNRSKSSNGDHATQMSSSGNDNSYDHGPYMPSSAFTEALRAVRPTAMHDVNLKPPPVHWTDIGGQDSVKTALRTAVHLINTPEEKLRTCDLRPPKGILLYGPPGCSKTMAAQAMATESGLNFFAVKGAELLNSYVGESERAVRNLFARARTAAPVMVFFDEIDAIAGARDSGEGKTTNGGLNVLTTLLNEMDGFEDMKGVLVIGATNRPQALDPALMRPGRFDQIIYVPPPDDAARRAILSAAVGKAKSEEGIEVEELVVRTMGYSGAEIAGMCADAKLAAFMREEDRSFVSMGDYTTAIEGKRKMITSDMLEGFRKWEQSFT